MSCPACQYLLPALYARHALAAAAAARWHNLAGCMQWALLLSAWLPDPRPDCRACLPRRDAQLEYALLLYFAQQYEDAWQELGIVLQVGCCMSAWAGCAGMRERPQGCMQIKQSSSLAFVALVVFMVAYDSHLHPRMAPPLPPPAAPAPGPAAGGQEPSS